MADIRDRKIITTSWDDGHPLDKKLCSLLKTCNIKGTIYAPLEYPNYDILNLEDLKNISKEFEIGSHTYSHQILPQLPKEEIMTELIKSKEKLEEITDHDVVSFCYPDGKYNQKVIDCVRKSGFKGARTTSILCEELDLATNIIPIQNNIDPGDLPRERIGELRKYLYG